MMISMLNQMVQTWQKKHWMYIFRKMLTPVWAATNIEKTHLLESSSSCVDLIFIWVKPVHAIRRTHTLLCKLLLSNCVCWNWRKDWLFNTSRSSYSQMFFEIGVLKNFAIFTGKYLCWTLFLIKLQAFRPANLLKRSSNTVVFLWILRNLTPLVADSAPYYLLLDVTLQIVNACLARLVVIFFIIAVINSDGLRLQSMLKIFFKDSDFSFIFVWAEGLFPVKEEKKKIICEENILHMNFH